MTINLGPVDGIVVHHGETPLRPTCRHDQAKPKMLHTSTADWERVTCQSCIEWRHA